MFNGIIKHTGIIKKINKGKNDCTIEVMSKIKFTNKDIGSSISCSGTCLTLTRAKKKVYKFYLSKETLNRTNFKFSSKGNIINLEKSIKYGDHISGHFVQGHIDTTSKIKKINIVGKSWNINFILSNRFKKYIIKKGSITINGVSLTISKILNLNVMLKRSPRQIRESIFTQNISIRVGPIKGMKRK